jgi:hypothetical protein
MKRALLVIGVVACSNPPLSLRFDLTDGKSQTCVSDTGNETTECSKISMPCKAVLSIRIVPPNDPTVPFISTCKEITQTTLCGIAGIDLPAPTVPIPEQVLEVQMAVFPKSEVTELSTGELICPIVVYGADGLPVANLPPCNVEETTCPVVPAVGGRAYYYPGDEKTVVHLGCTYLEQLQTRACSGENTVTVSASVTDFDTGFSVSGAAAQRLDVSVGEPHPIGDVFALNSNQAKRLELISNLTPPSWGADIKFDPQMDFRNAKCVDVREVSAQSTSTLTCSSVDAPIGDHLDMTGVTLSQATLNQVLGALGKTTFPIEGLVVGIVVDQVNAPVGGVRVVPTTGNVVYLSADRTQLVPGQTSTSGIFISQDAVFGTQFELQGSSVEATIGYGGLVEDKVTIVVIRLKPPTTGG